MNTSRVVPLAVGKTYYRLTFADPDLTMPSVEAMVFIGTNIFPEDQSASESTHYFQDTGSFIQFGGATDSQLGGQCQVYSYNGDSIQSIHDLTGLVEALKQIYLRAIELGEPQLRRASGKWE